MTGLHLILAVLLRATADTLDMWRAFTTGERAEDRYDAQIRLGDNTAHIQTASALRACESCGTAFQDIGSGRMHSTRFKRVRIANTCQAQTARNHQCRRGDRIKRTNFQARISVGHKPQMVIVVVLTR